MKVLAIIACILCLATVSQAQDTETGINCLAMNIYHEARGESVEGQRAVGLVTLHRVLARSYPDDICSVVYQPKQFSWTEEMPPVLEYDAWDLARQIAKEGLYYYIY